MKKLLIILLGLSLIPAMVFADEYTITPSIPDFDPHDGFFDPGSSMNPYVIKDQYGNQVGTIKPKIYDINPDDGFMDPGTYINPYIIELD